MYDQTPFARTPGPRSAADIEFDTDADSDAGAGAGYAAADTDTDTDSDSDLDFLTTTSGAATTSAPGGSNYAASNVTRLLCAGTYLDDGYRRAVIRTLLIERFRQIAPSYGYDVVPVLGHALAAHRLRQYHATLTYLGFLLFGLMWITNVLGTVNALLLFAWWAWASSYLLRIVLLERLIHDFKPSVPDAGPRSRSQPRFTGFRGDYPADERLRRDRVEELMDQQSADDGVIYYGRFVPFVGAGLQRSSWANAELLIEAPDQRADDADDVETGDGAEPKDGVPATGAAAADEETGLIEFDVDEITDYVAQRLVTDLRDEPEPANCVENLVVERRRYTKAVAKRVPGQIDPYLLSVAETHWEESYAAAREYLCVRIGSWDQEVVTSMFVGFDIKGNTLHTEFYPYVLPPIKDAFHIVDRLPDGFTPRLIGRVAFDALLALPFETFGTLLHPLAHRLPRAGGDEAAQLDRKLKRGGSGGSSSLGLARYAGIRIERGATDSVRELATIDQVHHFFQKSDIVKYTQIVERSLLRIIEDFLRDHNVDLADHRATQANILNQSFGDVHNHGDGSVTSQGNTGKQANRTKIVRPKAKEDS